MTGHVLLTRPVDLSQEIAHQIEEKGYKVSIQPFLEIAHQNPVKKDLDQYAGLIFTSQNAVHSFAEQYPERDIEIYTVGNQTTDTAKHHGFKTIQNADGHINDLEQLLLSNKTDKAFYYPRGEHISRPFDPNINIESDIFYTAEALESINPEIEQQIINGEFSHITFFSKRTAENFSRIIKRTDGVKPALHKTKALCLSNSMIEFLQLLPWQSIEVSPSPNREGLLSLLNNH